MIKEKTIKVDATIGVDLEIDEELDINTSNGLESGAVTIDRDEELDVAHLVFQTKLGKVNLTICQEDLDRIYAVLVAAPRLDPETIRSCILPKVLTKENVLAYANENELFA